MASVPEQSSRKGNKLIELARQMELALADLQQSLAEGEIDMAGDHALTVEEMAREFQQKAT